MARIVHFEIHVENPDRAIKFYRAVLGWEFSKWDGPMPYWAVKTGPDNEPGINGGALTAPGRDRRSGRHRLRLHGPGFVRG